MMKRLLLLYMAIVLPLCVINAQTIIRHYDFNWISSKTESLSATAPFQFEEQSGWDSETALPIFLFRIELSNYVPAEQVEISHEAKSIPFRNPKAISFIQQSRFGKDQFIKKYISTERGKHYLEIELIPILHNSIDNQFEKITSIDFQIQLPALSENKNQLKSSSSLPENSVLASGKWVKIKVTKSGIHKIPYSLLNDWGFSSPESVNIFGSGGKMLDRSNAVDRSFDLTENTIWHKDNDAIYFYAQGPISWEYNNLYQMFLHKKHDYTDEVYYYLTADHGDKKRINTAPIIAETATHETNEYDNYAFHEEDKQNLIKSGIEWYGERIDPHDSEIFNFQFNNIETSQPIKMMTRFIGRCNITSKVEVHANSDLLGVVSIPKVDYNTSTGNFAHKGYLNKTFASPSKNINIELKYDAKNSSASAWLNYICLNAKEKISLDNNQLLFRNNDMTGYNNITKFYTENTTSSTQLWDITTANAPIQVQLEEYDGKTGFTWPTDELKEFVLFNPSTSLPQPQFEENVTNQNLKGISVPEMLIIAHPQFEDEANRLAKLHMEHSGLKCKVVQPFDIYNEFSSGSPDISAIRDYVRYLYLKGMNGDGGESKLKYLLLFGDGSYDNTGTDNENTNFILTYQSDNSLDFSKSYTSDDFYGLLDEYEGANMYSGRLDIGIGRLPVKTVEEAKIVVDKIDNYLNKTSPGIWKTKVTFLADDGDRNLHMKQADELSDKLYQTNAEFNHKKIYFDAYPKSSGSAVNSYPGVNQDIMTNFDNGTLIFNYTGHGSESHLAHENVLSITDIQKLTNLNKLPVFVTATCEFSRFDDYHLTTAGEWVLLSPHGGGICMFTTTRVAWSDRNFEINKNFYKNVFEPEIINGIPQKARFGDIIRKTKNLTTSTTNKLNFTLLGDPAIQLAIPSDSISEFKIENLSDPAKVDTLSALSTVSVGGTIKPSNFSNNGSATIQVLDKKITTRTLGNQGATPFKYQIFESSVYKGNSKITDNKFSASFIVPKDIRYNVGKGRITCYAHDENGNEAFGANNNILIGGITENPPNDNIGPEIKLWLNDNSFKSGDITGSRPMLYAEISDESGINISGIGIGHDITLVIDNDKSKPITLNSYYIANEKTFNKGTVVYQLPELKKGLHQIELKVWDNLNNSSLSSTEFKVDLNGQLGLSNQAVFPNPVSEENILKVNFNHDAPNETLTTHCQIFDLSGRLMTARKKEEPTNGNSISPIEIDISGLPTGLYFVRCQVSTAKGQSNQFTKKILITKQ